MQPRLRIFTGETEPATIAPAEISMPFGDLAAIVSDAMESQRVWLTDFADDEVKIPSDLYEVLTTYQRLRPSA